MRGEEEETSEVETGEWRECTEKWDDCLRGLVEGVEVLWMGVSPG